MSRPGLQGAIEVGRDLVRAARRVVALTGAGISTDSGIPDFRGPDGVWTRDPAAERMATLQTYMADPEIRRAAWQQRLEARMHERQPNAGHRALVELERLGKLHMLITQNVDGLHHEAGTSPTRLIEIHGTAREAVCMACGERTEMREILDRVRGGEADPPCRSCGGVLKSATISFGQRLEEKDLERAREAAFACDLLLAVGSSLSVYPAADLVPVAKASGSKVIILNAQPTPMDGLADLVLHASISEILPRLLRVEETAASAAGV